MLFSIKKPIPEASSDLLGGKGYGLYQMEAAGISVPPAYIITPMACREYMADPAAMMAKVSKEYIPEILAGLSSEFGYLPLLSVRSGAKFSMPGMMDTILNVGLDPSVISEWSGRIGAACAEDSYKRLVEMYGSVVKGIERKKFEGKSLEERLVFYHLEVGEKFPNAGDQILGAIEAVFKSWNNDRAKTYRKLNNIPEDLGTAVIIQAMVFGNMNDASATGVAFSRNYSTGANEVVGDLVINGQGEDVVAGIRNTEPLDKMIQWNSKVFDEFMETMGKLEAMKRDMVDVEFTVQDGKLYFLQVRVGKRTAQAAVKIACDMVSEGVISTEEAIERVSLKQYLAASRPSLDPSWVSDNPPHGKGIPASNGVASGVAVFSSKNAVNCNEPCILIAEETTPDDIAGMDASLGILTSTGGATSHAAVVARGMEKVCVVGCTSLEKKGGAWVLSDGKVKRTIKEGDRITIDGSSGNIWIGVDVSISGPAMGVFKNELLSLLVSKYPFYEVCVSKAEVENATSDKLLLASYMVERNSFLEMPVVFRDMLLAVGDREAVVDLRSLSDVVRAEDQPMEFLFGNLNENALKEKVEVLLGLAKNPQVNKIKVLGVDSPVMVGKLVKAGYEVIPQVSDLDSLLDANGLCVTNHEALAKSVGKEVVAKVVSLKAAAGQKIRSFNIVPKIGKDQMGRNALIALSGVQAVQSFLPHR